MTVALVLKPDYGSVFARALQRSIGMIVGAVAGAVLLALVHGAWLLVPFGVLAALLPYGRKRNFGLLATFLTPLVVVLIDLLSPIGWRLAGPCPTCARSSSGPCPSRRRSAGARPRGGPRWSAWSRSVQAGVELPDDETLKPVTEAVQALLGVLGSGQRL